MEAINERVPAVQSPGLQTSCGFGISVKDSLGFA